MCKPCPTDRSLLCVFCFSVLLSGSTFWGSSEFQVVGPRLCHLLLVFCCLRPAEVQCLLFHEAWCVCAVFRSCGFWTLYFYPFSSQLERRIWYWHRHFIGNVPKLFHFFLLSCTVRYCRISAESSGFHKVCLQAESCQAGWAFPCSWRG